MRVMVDGSLAMCFSRNSMGPTPGKLIMDVNRDNDWIERTNQNMDTLAWSVREGVKGCLLAGVLIFSFSLISVVIGLIILFVSGSDALVALAYPAAIAVIWFSLRALRKS